MSSNSRFTIHNEAGEALNTFVGLASDNPFPVGSTYEGVVVHSVSSVVDETPTTEEIYAAREERRAEFSTTLDRMNPVWYNSLTTAQQTALATWRQQWLDYPDNGIKPDYTLVQGIF